MTEPEGREGPAGPRCRRHAVAQRRPACGPGLPRSRVGQVIVEMLLVLPVFLTLVFLILELGNMAFHTIIINHATYETARYGSLISAPKGGKGAMNISKGALEDYLKRIVQAARVVNAAAEPTVYDPQAEVFANDLILTTEYPIPLIFPITNFALSKPPGTGKRLVQITMRMPIEQPLFK